MNPHFFVVPITHVDLAWKRGRAEMSEMLEIVVIRLLDCLEHELDFRYHLEQAAHFRELQRQRPDLIARLKPFLDSGRLEFVGAMASTLENNLPNGECFVRNQAMGLRWVEQTWNAQVQTGWLIDTFGINAQVPQILRGFGFTQLMANRFGGDHTRDLFSARGLDGTEIPVAGWGTYSQGMKRENLSERFCNNWDDIEIVFDQADKLTGPGPFLVIPYTENEMLVSVRPNQLVRQRKSERPDQNWQLATPREWFTAIEQSNRELPVVHADLNPEFTGCFSLRQPIRLLNRVVETRLLEAEKWAALAGMAAPQLEEAWWQLHFVQFHDVFTGSHPTNVFHDVMPLLDEIEAAANEVLESAFSVLAPPNSNPNSTVVTAFNGLPWTRRDETQLELPTDFQGVSRVVDSDGTPLPFDVRDKTVRVAAPVSPAGWNTFSLESGPATSPNWRSVENVTIENEWIRLEFDTTHGIKQLLWKPTQTVLLDGAGNWLVAQGDGGNFQIENPNTAEVAASSGTIRLATLESPLGQTVRLSGEFPPLIWAGDDSFLRYSCEWFLPRNRAELQLQLSLDWRGEATRVRLCLPTELDTATGLFEIPFGVVARRAYSPRTNAKGEWPAHRFVALESDGHGLALINTGVAGVEVRGSTLLSTLLRAPASIYAGMTIDDTSSQHGNHTYRFSVVPYAGSWADAGVAQFAQERNNPVLTRIGAASSKSQSLLHLEPNTVVLSSVHAAHDQNGALIVRVYETAGRETNAVLTMPSVRQIWNCDLKETPAEEVEIENGEVRFSLRPFEIKSFLIRCEEPSP